MGIKIVSDGTATGTRIINTETGEDLSKVLSATYGSAITMGDMITAQLEVCMIEVDVVPGCVEWKIPNFDGSVSQIEMTDGTVITFDDEGIPQIDKPDQEPDEPSIGFYCDVGAGEVTTMVNGKPVDELPKVS